MRKSFSTFLFLVFTATAGAHNGAGADALPLDSIKPLRMMKADNADKAIDTKTNEKLKETNKPTATRPAESVQTIVEQDVQSAKEALSPADSPIRISQRTKGVFTVPDTEEMPTFPGGERALREFIRNNRQYPEECKARRLTGKVTVTITIAPDGVPDKMEITSSSGIEAMDNEAMRVAELMPVWTPAKDIENSKERIYNMTFTFRPGR